MILSTIIVLSFSLISAIENILVPFTRTGDMQSVIANPENLSQPANIIALILILSILLIIMILIGAYWLYRFFGENYYGGRGALRWVIFGALFAFLMMVPEWFLPHQWRLIINLLKFASVFIAFFVARKIVPIKPN